MKTSINKEQQDQLIRILYDEDTDSRRRGVQQCLPEIWKTVQEKSITFSVLNLTPSTEVPRTPKNRVAFGAPKRPVILLDDTDLGYHKISGNDKFFIPEIEEATMVTATIPEIMTRDYSILDKILVSVPEKIASEFDSNLFKVLNAVVDEKEGKKPWYMELWHWIKKEKYPELTIDLLRSSGVSGNGLRQLIVHYDMFVHYRDVLTEYLRITGGEVKLVVHGCGMVDKSLLFWVPEPSELGIFITDDSMDVYSADQFVNGQAAYGWIFHTSYGMAIYDADIIRLRVNLCIKRH